MRVLVCLLPVILISQAGLAGEIDLEKGRAFWAFQPPVKPAVPETAEKGAIDHFLEPTAAVAAKEVLVRRLYFDLHGLPPTPDQIDAFVNDPAEDAVTRLVDALLASPRFGERFGRHWLDIARYSESTGGGRTMLLPHAWRYRDYVIDSFNADKPYDKFVTEQIAGDLLPEMDPAMRRERLIATTFLALGPTNYELQDKELLRMEVIDEQVDTVGRTFMAMTFGCARCHDHMFDPISERDYYALAGIFHSTKTVEHANVSKWLTAGLPPVTEEEKRLEAAHKAYRERYDAANKEVKAAEKRLAELRKKTDASVLAGVVVDDTDPKVEKVGEWKPSTRIEKWVGDGYVHDLTETKS